MRTAQICPTCATFTNAACVIYDGLYLSNINVSPLDPLDVALGFINSSVGTINTSINGINTSINNINTSISNINTSIANINIRFTPLFGAGGPTGRTSTYIGQTYIDTTNNQMYFSYTTGVGTTTWQAVCSCPGISNRIFDFTFDHSFN